MPDEADRDAARVIRLLKSGPVAIRSSANPEAFVLGSAGREIAVRCTTLRRLASDGTVVRQGDSVALSRDGLARARRLEASADPYQNQHRDLEFTVGPGAGGHAAISVNAAESPLALLMRHRAKNGRAFLTHGEFGAGERLRSDYTRGRIMPRMAANWEASVSAGRRGGDAGLADLADSTLAARQRVDRALAAVGPELSGVLVDVCCFLKGLELVERERGWPVRSAKVVLKTALGALSRHYQPWPQKRDGGHGLHWGAEDYRPSLVLEIPASAGG